eukprot:COSAG02_NODE_62038_length_267_cov_0.601190_1_plen_56_part_01
MGGAPIGLAASGVLAIGGLYVLPYQQRALLRFRRPPVSPLQPALFPSTSLFRSVLP